MSGTLWLSSEEVLALDDLVYDNYFRAPSGARMLLFDLADRIHVLRIQEEEHRLARQRAFAEEEYLHD